MKLSSSYVFSVALIVLGAATSPTVAFSIARCDETTKDNFYRGCETCYSFDTKPIKYGCEVCGEGWSQVGGCRCILLPVVHPPTFSCDKTSS
jgi:hypothetical protein